MIIEKFDDLFKSMCSKLSDKGFESEKFEKSFLFYKEKVVYKVELCPEENKMYLYCQTKEDGDLNYEEGNDEWNRISSWLFEDEISSKDIDMICTDFADSIYSVKKIPSSRSKRKKEYSDKGADSLFFANRLVNIFPELRKEIFIEKESYSEFRGSVFIQKSILPKIMGLLSENKDEKKTEKLFKLLSDLYKNSSLNIRSLITMGIMNKITGERQINIIRKYISDDFNKAWLASMKFSDKKFSCGKKTILKNICRKFC